MTIPEQYLPVMPYLILSDAEAFLEFAAKVFGATEMMLVRDENDAIRHAEISIGKAVIMLAQSNENWGNKPAGMFIYVDDVDRTYAAGLERNAVSLMPPSHQQYGYAAGFEDRFGNQWWLAQGQ